LQPIFAYLGLVNVLEIFNMIGSRLRSSHRKSWARAYCDRYSNVGQQVGGKFKNLRRMNRLWPQVITLELSCIVSQVRIVNWWRNGITSLRTSCVWATW